MNFPFLHIIIFSAALTHSSSCGNDPNRPGNKNNEAGGFVIGSSKMDNKTKFEKAHPEVKKAIGNLIESNKNNAPEIVERKVRKSTDSSE